jgi:hypothetical protein
MDPELPKPPKPLMLSELIALLGKLLAASGDKPVRLWNDVTARSRPMTDDDVPDSDTAWDEDYTLG